MRGMLSEPGEEAEVAGAVAPRDRAELRDRVRDRGASTCGTVGEYLRRVKEVSFAQVEAMDDGELERALYPPPPGDDARVGGEVSEERTKGRRFRRNRPVRLGSVRSWRAVLSRGEPFLGPAVGREPAVPLLLGYPQAHDSRDSESRVDGKSQLVLGFGRVGLDGERRTCGGTRVVGEARPQNGLQTRPTHTE
jgi:hypothetical protein